MRNARTLHIVCVCAGLVASLTSGAPHAIAGQAQNTTFTTNTLYSPAAVYQSTLNRIAVFVNASNGHLYDEFWNRYQWIWEDQGPPPGARATSQTAFYDPAFDRIHTYVTGDNGHLYEKYWDATQYQWVWVDWLHPSFANWVFGPSAVSNSNGISVSAVGSDGHLYELSSPSQDVAISWHDHGTPGPNTRAYSRTSSVQRSLDTSLDRIAVFVTGDNGHLYDELTGGQWEDQGRPVGVNWVVNPAAVYQSATDRTFVFVTGLNNGHLYDKYWNGQQWVWEDQGTAPGGVKTNFPAAISASDRIFVFVTGNNGHLYDKYWNGHEWVWEDQGIPAGANYIYPQASGPVYQALFDRPVVFVVGDNGHLYDKYWNGHEWVWEDQGNP